MFSDVVKYFQYTQDSKSLYEALAILAIFLIFVFFIALYQWKKRKIEFQHFQYLLKDRGFEFAELKKLFNYLTSHNIEPHLILESEEIMERAAKACGMDVERVREKLGFNTSLLIKNFIKRQQELRKKWNKH